jgi:hypothetical protein
VPCKRAAADHHCLFASLNQDVCALFRLKMMQFSIQTPADSRQTGTDAALMLMDVAVCIRDVVL